MTHSHSPAPIILVTGDPLAHAPLCSRSILLHRSWCDWRLTSTNDSVFGHNSNLFLSNGKLCEGPEEKETPRPAPRGKAPRQDPEAKPRGKAPRQSPGANFKKQLFDGTENNQTYGAGANCDACSQKKARTAEGNSFQQVPQQGRVAPAASTQLSKVE